MRKSELSTAFRKQILSINYTACTVVLQHAGRGSGCGVYANSLSNISYLWGKVLGKLRQSEVSSAWAIPREPQGLPSPSPLCRTGDWHKVTF